MFNSVYKGNYKIYFLYGLKVLKLKSIESEIKQDYVGFKHINLTIYIVQSWKITDLKRNIYI